LIGHAGESPTTYEWLQATPESVVVTDGDGRVLAVNTAFERLFGVTGSSILGEPIEELIIPSRFRSAYRARRRMVLADGPARAFARTDEYSALRADGGEFAVELKLARTHGDPPEVGTWIRDLTEDRAYVAQTLHRAALHESAEALAGIGSWGWEHDSSHLRWSDNMFRILGLKPREVTPSLEYLFVHCHADDRQRVKRAVGHLCRTGRLPQLRYRYVMPGGTERHMQAAVASVAESEGLPRRMIGTIQDVTERRQAEREIAARFAVSEALCDWKAGEPGVRRLLRDLAEALDFELGALWIPHDDVLTAWVVWQARTLQGPELESSLRTLRVGRGVGLLGTAWESGEPAQVAELSDYATASTRELIDRAGLRGALAVPATHGQEVLAVLGFASRQEGIVTDRFTRSLIGIGHEIGTFLARRRGELCDPLLTVREREVLQLAATGHARRQIATKLEVSESTVKTHFEHIYAKLGVTDRASAVGEALRRGLVD
jgi:PAS domain S-box-containing protein